MNTAASAADFLARYDGLAGRLPGEAAPRQKAAQLLRERGLPTRRDEDWKYTSLAPVTETRFHEALTDATGDAGVTLPDLGVFGDMARLVFVQGRYDPRHSLPPGGGLHVRGFAQDAAFGRLARPERDRVVALNTMLAEDGAIIDVPAGVDGGALLMVSLGRDLHGTPMAAHPRHAITLGDGAALTLIEIFAGAGTYLHNPVTEVTVGAGARLTHVRLQTESEAAFHLATLYADVAARGAYDCFTLHAGAKLARAEIHAALHGEGAHVALNAAQMLRGSQHGDITTFVAHDAPGCTSRQTVKHVLGGKARGVFQGRIDVARAAQKTDGYQMNQAVLLPADAEIDCKPQLQIYADDVKCSHGATVGELDSEQLFYLVSRGIPREQAKAMLIHAFLEEALEGVTHEAAKAALQRCIEGWWEGAGA